MSREECTSTKNAETGVAKTVILRQKWLFGDNLRQNLSFDTKF